MQKIKTIALNTLKESIRDRVLYIFLFFAVFMSMLSIILGSLSVGNNLKIILDMGLGSINIFGVIIAVFIGTSLVFKEIDRKTIYVILAKPIERWEFILGKFFGLSITLTFLVSLMAVVFFILLYLNNISSQQLYLTFISIIMILMELYLMTAISILFSCFSTPLLSMVFAYAAWIIGHFNPVMLTLAQYANSEAVVKIVTFFHYFFPDLSKFNIKNNIDKLDYIVNYPEIGLVIIYGILYTTVVLMVSIYAFNRKEFS